MAERVQLETKPVEAPAIQIPKSNTQFFSTGSTLLDLALGGGWAHPFIFNLVGDRSSGKTLLGGIEAFANFERTFKSCQMRYSETEARFDPAYAATMGFPLTVTRPEEVIETVEDFKDDLYEFIQKCTPECPGLYILDSLDALSDDATIKKYEKSQNTGKRQTSDDGEGGGEEKVTGSYGTAKAKALSGMFSMFNKDMVKNAVTLGIISQLRDNIGVSFGETSTRSGGRALNFYASQIVWLREETKETKTNQGEVRAVAVNTHAKVKKCSVGMPFREARFQIVFGYGVDDEMSLINWLTLGSKYDKDTIKDVKSRLVKARDKQDYAAIQEIHSQLKADAVRVWKSIDENLAPSIRKYR